MRSWEVGRGSRGRKLRGGEVREGVGGWEVRLREVGDGELGQGEEVGESRESRGGYVKGNRGNREVKVNRGQKERGEEK